MLLELTTLALELVADISEPAKADQEKDPDDAHQPQQNLVVIELDHMRDRRRYIDALRYLDDVIQTNVDVSNL